MIRRKPKEFATGARTLRGGKNHYTAKTLCGNWVEDMYDPSFEAVAAESKFDANFLSTAQNDMRDGVGMKSKRFGAGFDMYDNVKLAPQYPVKDWKGLTQSEYTGGKGPRTEFSTAFHMPANEYTKSQSFAESYRERWTQEESAHRGIRFQSTNNNGSGWVPSEFKASSVRALPGVPNSITKLRSTLITKCGPLTFLRLRMFLVQGADESGMLSEQALTDSLVAYDGGLRRTSGAPVLPERQLGLSLGELSVSFQYFDTERRGKVHPEHILRTIRGNLSDSRRKMIEFAFKNIASEGSSDISIGAAKGAYQGKDINIWAFDSRNGAPIVLDEFVDFYHCTSPAYPSDESFERMLANDWKLRNSKVTGKFGEIRAVRVTHADGRVTEEKIEWDVTMEDDINLARTYLLAQGIRAKKVQKI